MCRRVGEPSRASRARAAVGSPPGQCRQSNYPSASSSPFSHCLSLSTFLSVSLALALSRCAFGHIVSVLLSFSLFLSLLLPSSLPSLHPVLLSSLPLRTRVQFYSFLSRFPLSSILPRALRFHPVGYSLLLDRSERRASELFLAAQVFRPSPLLCTFTCARVL